MPKPGWKNTDVRGALQRALKVNIAFDMDVNAAALGKFQWGASQECDPSLYLTIGTGIGGVMQREFLFPKIRRRVQELLNCYLSSPSLLTDIDNTIVPPALGNRSGSLGAIALAQMEK
jgi:hypothetical protein